MDQSHEPSDAIKAARKARLDHLASITHPLNAKMHEPGQYNAYTKAFDEHYKPTGRLVLANTVLDEPSLKRLCRRLNHDGMLTTSTLYLMELLPDVTNPHPVHDEARVYIAAGVFDRNMPPDTNWHDMISHRRYPANLIVSLIVTAMDGHIVSDAELTGYTSVDRVGYPSRLSNGKMCQYDVTSYLTAGIVDYSGRIIFSYYRGIHNAAMMVIRLLAEKQIEEQHLEVPAVWLLAALEKGVSAKIENHIDIKEAIETYRAKKGDNNNDSRL